MVPSSSGFVLLVALSHPETGVAHGTLFIDDGISVAEIGAREIVAKLSVNERTLESTLSKSRQVLTNSSAHGAQLAFSTTISAVTPFSGSRLESQNFC